MDFLFKNVEPTEKAGDCGGRSTIPGANLPSSVWNLERSIDGTGGVFDAERLGDEEVLIAGELFTWTTAGLARTTVAVAASGETMALLL